MNAISVQRRCGIAVVALLSAAVLFHGQVADALVTRGDDAIRNGDRNAGIRYYRRAIAIDAASSRAADRLAFYLAMRHADGDARAAIVVATEALVHDPVNAALLADRGLAEQRLRRWAAAQADFGAAAAAGRDARYAHLAGRIALRRALPGRARAYFAAALRYDPHFSPARVALARL